MGKFQVLESGLSLICKRGNVLPKVKINSETVRYIPKKSVSTTGWQENLSQPIDEFVRTTPKPPRPVTSADMYNFRMFLLGKKVDLNITPQELKTLFSYEGEEYKLKAFELLTKKMNIPKDLEPAFTYGAEYQTPMCYDFILNTVKVNPNFAEQLSDKSAFLSILRHEMQHYAQNMSMFRHETKGNELISIYSKMASKNVHKNVDNYARNFSLEQLLPIFDEQGLKDIMYLKDLLKNNKFEEYNNYLYRTEEEMYKHFNSLYTDFRKTIVDKMGIIKKDSAEGKRAEKFFNETLSGLSYWEKDGSINLTKYFSDSREVEALTAQDMISMRLSSFTSGNDKYCYIKTMREAQEYMKKHVDELNPQLKELVNTKEASIEDTKKAIKYLFE